MRDFLKKEFLLGLGTGFIISAIIISLYGTDLPAAGQAGNTNKLAEAGGNHEADKKNKPPEGTAENTEKTSPSLKENIPDAAATSTKDTADSTVDAAKPKTGSTANSAKSAQQIPPLNTTVKTEKYADVVVKAGMTSERISSILEEQGIIEDKDAFYKLVTAHKAHAKFKIGTFKVPVGGDMEEILGILTGQQ